MAVTEIKYTLSYTDGPSVENISTVIETIIAGGMKEKSTLIFRIPSATAEDKIAEIADAITAVNGADFSLIANEEVARTYSGWTMYSVSKVISGNASYIEIIYYRTNEIEDLRIDA